MTFRSVYNATMVAFAAAGVVGLATGRTVIGGVLLAIAGLILVVGMFAAFRTD
ncbi:hypothetical protein [Actinopolymorpha alba]|uniref:hypothetical protein n=1 Tax=Actinopolymorpha alba TaxID=533267 RepID=UPI0003A44339|nr:hypothetical protein [Actinopolymorpha alba]